MSKQRNSKTIDLNCDMGEGIGHDLEIMPFISSANIACGYHAGNVETMKQTVEMALHHQVKIGAHPSFPDKVNFGRKEMNLSPEAIYELTKKQITMLNSIAQQFNTSVHHVKPHGALYTMSAKNRDLAQSIAQAVKDLDSNLILIGLSGSYSVSEAKKAGIKTLSEVFADRTYRDDGSLTPRTEANALIENPEVAGDHVLQMIKERTVTTISGKKIPILAETICIHGDGYNAVEIIKRIHKALKNEKIRISSNGNKSGAANE